MNLTGGAERFTAKLDTFFSHAAKPGEVNGNASGFIGQYAHGNEPSHHVTYLYDYVKQPWKTQLLTAKVMNELYNTSSSGYAGNEDCGQMSAWYVFSAIGFYPVNPASGIYAIGSPAMQRAILQIGGGKTFTVIAQNASAVNIYIQAAKLNGKKHDDPFLNQRDIMKGGTLEFIMGPEPNKNWGISRTSVSENGGF